MPYLSPTSGASLNLLGEPILTFKLQLDVIDLDPSFTFPDCAQPPVSISMSYNTASCDKADWEVVVRYADDCLFTTVDTSADVTLSGDVNIAATAVIDSFHGEAVVQQLSRDISFELTVPTLLSEGSAGLSVTGSRVCWTVAECFGEECTAEGDCVCSAESGRAGQTCADDIADPVFTGCPVAPVLEDFTGALPALSDYVTLGVSDNVDSNMDLVLARDLDGTEVATGAAALVLDDALSAGVSFAVVVSAEDLTGNVAVCSFSVTLSDVEDPTVVCPADVLTNLSPATWDTPTSADNIAVDSLVSDHDGGISIDGDYTITYTVSDAAGNTAQCAFALTLDTTPPVITCPGDSQLYTDVDSDSAALVTIPTTTIVETGSLPTVTTYSGGLVDGTVLSLTATEGDHTFTYVVTVTDNAGNSATCNYNVVLSDDKDPVLTCPAQLEYDVASDGSTVTKSGTDIFAETGFSATDNVAVESLLLGGQALSTEDIYPIGTVTIQFAATDYASNSVTCDVDVVVSDPHDPVVTCPADASLPTDEGQDYATVSLSEPLGATDNDNIASVVIKQDGVDVITFLPPTPVGSSDLQATAGVTNFQAIATDASGNTASCNFTVTVADTEGPTYDCPTAAVIFTALPGDSNAFVVVTATEGITQTDSAGVFQSTVFALNAADNGNDVTDLIPGGDVSSTFGITYAGNDPQTFTFALSDTFTNAGDSCTVTVNVLDAEDPVLACPGMDVQSVTGDLSERGDASFTVTATDNAEIISVTFAATPAIESQNVTPNGDDRLLTGSFAFGVTTVDVTTTDKSGLTDTCQIIVDIAGKCGDAFVLGLEECEKIGIGCSDTCTCTGTYEPSLSQLRDCVVVLTSSNAVVSAELSIFNIEMTETLKVQPLAYEPRSSGGLSFHGGNHILVSGQAGQRSLLQMGGGSCDDALYGEIFDMEVYIDMVLQTGALATGKWFDIEVCEPNADTSLSLLYATSAIPTAWINTETQCTDVNGADAPPREFDPMTGCYTFHTCHAGPHFRTATIDADCADLFTCDESTIYIDGTTDPFPVSWVEAERWGNTEGNTAVPTSVPLSGANFPVGTTTVTYTGTGELVGTMTETTTTCSFDVVVADKVPPVLSGCPDPVTLNSDADQAYGTQAITPPTALDNVDGAVTVTSDVPTGNQYPIGDTTVTYSATDAAGNPADCSVVVTVTDNENPVAVCSDVNINNDAGLTTATYDPADLSSQVTATDNHILDDCVTDLSMAGNTGDQWTIGTHPVGVTCTDVSGNADTCTINVIVADVEAPVPSCSDITWDVPGTSFTVDTAALIADSTVSFTDNNAAAVTVSWSNEGPYTGPIDFAMDTYELVYFVDDGWLSANCSVIVTPVDTGDPVVTCPADFGSSPALLIDESVYGTITATDNDVAASTITTDEDGSFFIGPTTVTYTATDAAGNTGTCSFVVTITDTEDPVYTACTDVNLLVSTVTVEAAPYWSLPVFTDNNPHPNGADSNVVTSGPSPADALVLGSQSVTTTATDASGNTATCTFNLVLTDDVDPVISGCLTDDTVALTDAEAAKAVAYTVVVDPVDSFGTITTLFSATNDGLEIGNLALSGSLSLGPGVHVIRFEARDSTGNSDFCTFTITVEDLILPTLTCDPDTIIRSTDSATNIETVNYDYTAADNVALQSVVASPAGYDFSLGDTLVTITATDTSDNVQTCTFTITVLAAFVSPPTYDAVVDSVQVLKLAASTYGADLVFRTDVIWPYKMSLAGGETADVVSLTENTAHAVDNCPADEGVDSCVQQFVARVQFASCSITTSQHVFKVSADCTHGGCALSPFAFDITLSIQIDDDLCSVKGLDNVSLYLEITTSSPSQVADWQTAADFSVAPTEVTLFDESAPINAVMRVLTDELEVLSVVVQSATKQYFEIEAPFDEALNVALVTDGADVAPADSPITLASETSYAVLGVTNNDIPISTRYTSTLTVAVLATYRLTSADGNRRRLLTVTLDTSSDKPAERRHWDLLSGEGEDSSTMDGSKKLFVGTPDDGVDVPHVTIIMGIHPVEGEFPIIVPGRRLLSTVTVSQMEAAILLYMAWRLQISEGRMGVTLLSYTPEHIQFQLTIINSVSEMSAGMVADNLQLLVQSTTGLGLSAALEVNGVSLSIRSDPNNFYRRSSEDSQVATTPTAAAEATLLGLPLLYVAGAGAGLVLLLLAIGIILCHKRRSSVSKLGKHTRTNTIRVISATEAKAAASEQAQLFEHGRLVSDASRARSSNSSSRNSHGHKSDRDWDSDYEFSRSHSRAEQRSYSRSEQRSYSGHSHPQSQSFRHTDRSGSRMAISSTARRDGMPGLGRSVSMPHTFSRHGGDMPQAELEMTTNHSKLAETQGNWWEQSGNPTSSPRTLAGRSLSMPSALHKGVHRSNAHARALGRTHAPHGSMHQEHKRFGHVSSRNESSRQPEAYPDFFASRGNTRSRGTQRESQDLFVGKAGAIPAIIPLAMSPIGHQRTLSFERRGSLPSLDAVRGVEAADRRVLFGAQASPFASPFASPQPQRNRVLGPLDSPKLSPQAQRRLGLVRKL